MEGSGLSLLTSMEGSGLSLLTRNPLVVNKGMSLEGAGLSLLIRNPLVVNKERPDPAWASLGP